MHFPRKTEIESRETRSRSKKSKMLMTNLDKIKQRKYKNEIRTKFY